MRVFQLMTFGQPYLKHFDRDVFRQPDATHEETLAALLADRYGNAHILLPVLTGDSRVRLAVGDATRSQLAWARGHGLGAKTPPNEIVLAQVEEHRSEIFYNLSPVVFENALLRKLPGCVRKTICWRAAPLGGVDLSGYDLRVGNFLRFIDEWNREGLKSAWFEPAHDPVASDYARGEERDIDIAFAGTYSWLHSRRNLLLQRVAELASRHVIRFHFSLSRSARLANALGPLRGLLPKQSLPAALRQVSQGPVYGRAMYEVFGRARIVLNAAIDMASDFRGNMRCWEAMGCGALMLSDEGRYPPGMMPGRDFVTYRDSGDAIETIDRVLSGYDAFRPVAASGQTTMETRYTKEAQWTAFQNLAENA